MCLITSKYLISKFILRQTTISGNKNVFYEYKGDHPEEFGSWEDVFHTSSLADHQGVEDMKSLIKISQRIFLSTLIAKLTKAEKPLHN